MCFRFFFVLCALLFCSKISAACPHTTLTPLYYPFCFPRQLILFARFTGGAVFEGTYSGVRGPHVVHFCPCRPVAGLHLLLFVVRTAQNSYCTVNNVRRQRTVSTVRYGEYRTMRHRDCRIIRILCRAVRHTLHNITRFARRHKRSTEQPKRLLIVPNTIDLCEIRCQGLAESVQRE